MKELGRLRAGTIAASLASLPFALPHVLEDFDNGIAARVGVSTGQGAVLLGLFLAAQSLGLVLVGQGRRGGFILTFWVGVIWVAGAAVEHGPALLAGGPSASRITGLWLGGLVLAQAAATLLALWGWLLSRSRRSVELRP